ncbi:hypothetical protein V8F20_007757 [Naviculisporaceae sp. PSN 640]
MSGSYYDSDPRRTDTPGFVRSFQGGANLFSPTASEGTLERGRSVLPGVVPRDGPSAPYSNRRGQPNYGSDLTDYSPPAFNVGEHSSRSNARQSVPSTPPNQTDQGDSEPSSMESLITSPTTAALIRQLQSIHEVTHEGAKSPDSHPAIQALSKKSADVLNRVWKLRTRAPQGEIGNMMDVDLMVITTGLLDEYKTAKRLAEEAIAQKDRADKLNEEAARARDALARAKEQIEEEKAKYDTLTKDMRAQINNLTVRLQRKEETERSLHETIRGLKAQEAARDQTIKLLSHSLEGNLHIGSSTTPAPTSVPPSAAGSVSRPAPPRPQLRPSAMEFQQQVLATVSSAERLRLPRPAERPSGASDFGSPIPKRSSLTTMVAPAIESDDVRLWREEFGKLLGVVRNYTRYWKHTPRDWASTVQNDPGVWQHLRLLAHPTQPEAAQAFITRLVSERPSIPFLIERVVNQFLVDEVFSVDAWMDWDSKSDQRLRQIEQRLKEIDLLDTHKRMALVTERSTMIASRMGHQKWAQWKGFRKSTSFQKFRSVVAPLTGIKEKEDALYDLFTILEEAWELAPKIMTSNFTFKLEFPTPGQKLTNDNANELEVQYNEYHQQQLALQYAGGEGAPWGCGRLIVTPMISMRDERVMGAMTTLVVKPDVLMRR